MDIQTPASSSMSLSEAVTSIRDNLGFGFLEHYGVLEITGPDTLSFLQNRTTNDIHALDVGQGHASSLIDRQGKIQAVFTLHRTSHGVRILIEAAQIPRFIEQMEKYHILEQFTMTDISDNYSVLAIQGPRSSEFLTNILPSAPQLAPFSFAEASLEGDSFWYTPVSITGEEGYLLVIPKASSNAILGKLQQHADEYAVLTPEVLDVLRIEAGIPRYGQEYNEETLLPETGLESQTVSYTKGCYLGQEVIARIKTYGAIPRLLSGLVFEDYPQDSLDKALPGVPAPILLEGQPIGTLTSVTHSPSLQRVIGLVFLGKQWRVPGDTFTVEIENKTFVVKITRLPFMGMLNGKENAKRLLETGLRAFSEGHDEAAIASLREAIQLDAENIEAYEALGVILGRHDQVDEAIVMMEKILALEPEHVLAHTNLSVFWLKKGNKDKAEEEKAKATVAAMRKKAKEAGLELPDPEEERRKKQEQLEERVRLFYDALQYNPDDPLGNFGLGSALLELGRHKEAIEPLQRTISAQPKHSVAYLSLGKAYEGAKQLELARSWYQKGIEVAAARGDMMPLQEMQGRLANI